MTNLEMEMGKVNVKRKVIMQVKELALDEGLDMEVAQDKVAKNMAEKTGEALEQSKKIVRYIIAEFIQEGGE